LSGSEEYTFEHSPAHLYDFDDPHYGTTALTTSDQSCLGGGNWADYDHDSGSSAAAAWPFPTPM
jgi:hypothetical protein